MRELRFSIKHWGCWGNIATAKYPGVFIRALSSIEIENKTNKKTTWSCLHSFESNDKKELFGFMEFLKNMKMNAKVEELYHSDYYALAHIISSARSSITEHIYANNCYILNNTLSNGWEHWHLLAKSSADVENLVTELKKHGEVVIDRVGGIKLIEKPPNLTRKQAIALRIALEHEYYSWPRKTRLKDLSKFMNISRRAFEDHLRKAEVKVLPRLLEKELMM